MNNAVNSSTLFPFSRPTDKISSLFPANIDKASFKPFANFPWLTNITYFIVVAPLFFIFSNNSLYINYSINIDENNHMSTITKWALHLSQFYFIHYEQ